ncbi:MAG: glycosyltransferase family 39 protein [Chloroflexota bacterium]
MITHLAARIPPLEKSRKYQLLLLTIVTFMALILRFYKLGEWSLWIDEIFTIERVQAHYLTLEATLRNLPPQTNWIPTSLLLTSAALNLWGISEWSARLAPALIGVVSIPILYFPTRQIFGMRVALISALLLAVSPWHLIWSQNARFYPALMLFYMLALLAIFSGLERDRPWQLVAGLLFFYLALSERIFALLLGPVVAGYLLLLWLLPFEKPAGFNRRNLLLLSLPLIAGLLIEGISWLTAGYSRFFGDFGWFFLYVNNTPARLLGTTLFNVGLPLICLALLGGLYLLRQKSRPGLLLLTAALLPLLLLLPVSLFMFVEDRYLFVTLPAWIILGAVVVDEIWQRLGRQQLLLAVALLGVLLADAVADNLLHYQVNEGSRRDWRGAFALVQEQAGPADTVVAFWPEFAPFYLDREIVAWDEMTPRRARETAVAGDHPIWFVVDSETVWGNLPLKSWLETNAELIEVFYLRTPSDQSLRIYRYAPTGGGVE